MLIESSKPLTVRLRSGTVHLEPGQAKEFTEEDGRKLLIKAKGTVRMIQPQPPDWAARWTRLAQATTGLEPDDPRLDPVLKGLADCDRCYKAGDLDGFTTATARVRRLMQFVPGATVRWGGSREHRLTVLGPSVIEHVHDDHGRLWVWVDWKGGRWISESIITQIDGPTT